MDFNLILRYEQVLILLIALVIICASIFISVICIKLIQDRLEKQRNIDAKKIKSILKRLFAAEYIDFFGIYRQSVSKLKKEMGKASFCRTLEEILLKTIEQSDEETKVKARMLAYDFDFPKKCTSMIRERLTSNVAMGCYKAGMYQYPGALPDLLKALNILSSEVQFQALIALSRIGSAETLVQAFGKINKFIFINTRAVTEILGIFQGNRYELFRQMIHNESDFLVNLFLKAIDKETANTLIEDIVSIYKKGGKETRLACITAIGKSENSSKIPIVIKALSDSEWEIRAIAAKILGVMTSQKAIPPLSRAACDREWWVRQNAITSILAYPNHREILASIAQKGDKYAYDCIVYTLGKAGKPGLLNRIVKIWPQKSRGFKPVDQAS